MRERVVLLAVDGLDWSRIRDGVEAGRLPEFARLLQEGAHAEVPVSGSIPILAGAEEGMNSPTLWTTIATGQYYFQHGVYDFTNAMVSVQDPPLFESVHVHSPRIWDMLGPHDIPSLVLGYYVTHPAYAINGVMVSDLFGEVQSPNGVWPVGRADEFARLLGAGDYADYLRTIGVIGTETGVREVCSPAAAGEGVRETVRAILRRFTGLSDDDVNTFLDAEGDQRVRQILEYRLIYPHIRDVRFQRLLLALMDSEQWRFATAYYRLVDFVSHGFWVAGHQLSSPFTEHYGEVVDRAYVWIDECVGEVRAKLHPDDRLIVMSDHGFCLKPNADVSDQADAVWEVSLGQHAEPAVLLVQGGSIQGRVGGVSLLDIAPTILDYLGLAQAESFDGGVVPGLLSEDAPRDLPVIEAYPYTCPDAGSGMTEREHEMVMKRLMALGYVD